MHETPGRTGLAGQLLHHFPRAVRGTIVHKDKLIGEALQGTVDPGLELRQGLGLVVERYNDAKVHNLLLVRGIVVVLGAVERPAEELLHKDVAGHDGRQHRAVQVAVGPLEQEGQKRQAVQHAVHLLLL